MRYVVARRSWPFGTPLQRPWGLYRVDDQTGRGTFVALDDRLAVGFYVTPEDAEGACPEPAEVRR